MQVQNEPHVFKGLQRDLSISKYDTSYLYDAHNIRLTAREEDTLLSITNEKGPKELNVSIKGNYLGHCLLNQYLVIMSTKATGTSSGKDFITRIDLSKDTPESTIIFDGDKKGSLNFSPLHPIETIGSYENASIQKVYWTDGYNQPRIINISPTYDSDIEGYNSGSFDFVQELALNEVVSVKKEYGAGEFPSGVLQYAFTYYNKHKQESNIFYTTPLLYTSFRERGGNPEEKVANSFRINVTNLDSNFDYLRIYSILRTSIDATPVVKRIQDIEISKEALTPVSKGFNIIALDAGNTTPKFRYSKNDGVDFNNVEGKACTADSLPFQVKVTTDVEALNSWLEKNRSDALCAFIIKGEDCPNLVLETTVENKVHYYSWDKDSIDVSAASMYGIYSINYGGYILISETSEDAAGWLVENSSAISVSNVSYVDNGESGEDVDPTELLYKGGEAVIAQTIEQKDGTLFLGNIEVERTALPTKVTEAINAQLQPKIISPDTILLDKNINVTTVLADVTKDIITNGDFAYANCIGASGFKKGEIYRVGIQFQYKTGKWSEPVWLRDYRIDKGPTCSSAGIQNQIPQIRVSINTSDKEIRSALLNSGYKKARLLMAQPTEMDRTILCQGILNPTVYREISRYTLGKGDKIDTTALGSLYAQSSWLFRPKCDFPNVLNTSTTTSEGAGLVPSSGNIIDLTAMYGRANTTDESPAPRFRSVEIGVSLDDVRKFKIDQNLTTFHSPDLEFNDYLSNYIWGSQSVKVVGNVYFKKTYGDIDIQTSSATIGSAAGFTHRSISTSNYGASLVAGLFYEDYIVDDTKEDSVVNYIKYDKMAYPVLWPVYMWHHSGSLNNDVSRSGRSATLLKKKISNYHTGSGETYNTGVTATAKDIQLFSSSQISMIKVNSHPYMGNIDTAIAPISPEGKFLAGTPYSSQSDESTIETPTFFSDIKWSLFYGNVKSLGPQSIVSHGLWHWQTLTSSSSSLSWYQYNKATWSSVGNVVNNLCNTSESIRMKYKSTPHLVIDTGDQNLFNNSPIGTLPIAEITVPYNPDTLYGGKSDDALKANLWIPISEPVSITSNNNVVMTSNQGDTYYQKFECLKTYAFTPEDENQVIDIASFLVETHVNIDGRYDRNRGQASNLNMSPTNFNLINKVYSQSNNFFNYRILDNDFYKIKNFPNQITWTKEKQSGADTDLWTNITLASVYNLDGSKGEIVSLNTWKDNIYCFQDRGISNILFNSRVQIPASDGVPIEISNSYKVDGYRYLSDGTGCSKESKKTIQTTPAGIYFIDSTSTNLYHIGEGITDVSTAHNMTTWFKQNTVKNTVYDNINHDLYLVSNITALCYSEVLGQFVSFMDYAGIAFMESYNRKVFTMHHNYMYQMFNGDYNIFFGAYYPWDITLVSNGIARSAVSVDKIFSNIEYRMDLKTDDYLHDSSFDYIQVTNEYQDTGVVPLNLIKNKPSNLKKKFRVWHIDIPRDNNSGRAARDRIRNTWCKIKLGMWGATHPNIENSKKTAKAELHDINVQYYI